MTETRGGWAIGTPARHVDVDDRPSAQELREDEREWNALWPAKARAWEADQRRLARAKKRSEGT